MATVTIVGMQDSSCRQFIMNKKCGGSTVNRFIFRKLDKNHKGNEKEKNPGGHLGSTS